MRFGSAGEALRWYTSQPAKCGPLTSHFLRVPSEVRMNAPLWVPTSNRTLLIAAFSQKPKRSRFRRFQHASLVEVVEKGHRRTDDEHDPERHDDEEDLGALGRGRLLDRELAG